ncbi:hypothetical protein [Desulfosporosinus sp.]|uniref:hypothetical protein n=1 Tax=Desulfosporosinus sp. TaxID=157907 RepID=UPI0025B82F59|nr:hypothetical protein [Desulfosporosinus sp.]MBC2727070.1 hypothetical protein [Desulfosporosinus sp.]
MKFCLKLVWVLVILLVTTGCNNGSSTSDNNNQTPTVINDQQPISNSNQTNIKTETGRYNGQIDANSIEVNSSNVPEEITPEVYRLSESLKATFDTFKLNSGDTVKLNYKLNEAGQKVIEELTILNRSSQNPQPPSTPKNPTQTKNDTGRYVGQIDNNSIEILISGVPEELSAKAFKLSDSVKANFHTYALQKNDQVKITFIPQNEGQPIITKIEKLDV